MSKVTRVKSFSELRTVLKRDNRRRERRLEQGRKNAARLFVSYLRPRIPVAFGELRSSVHVEGTLVVVDAPHAAAVERGSRPHWMPLQPLIEWVKLRGFQGLASPKSLARLPGRTTTEHATNVASQLDDQRRGGAGHSGPARPYGVDADVVNVAKGIQLAIALKGTKPHWYMRDSLPMAREFLRVEIGKAMSKDG